jgi:hypothetical protein
MIPSFIKLFVGVDYLLRFLDLSRMSLAHLSNSSGLASNLRSFSAPRLAEASSSSRECFLAITTMSCWNVISATVRSFSDLILRVKG